jgi:hypothetical protein
VKTGWGGGGANRKSRGSGKWDGSISFPSPSLSSFSSSPQPPLRLFSLFLFPPAAASVAPLAPNGSAPVSRPAGPQRERSRRAGGGGGGAPLAIDETLLVDIAFAPTNWRALFACDESGKGGKEERGVRGGEWGGAPLLFASPPLQSSSRTLRLFCEFSHVPQTS